VAEALPSCVYWETVKSGCIDVIRRKVHDGEYEFAIPHFFEKMANRRPALADIESAIATPHPASVHPRSTRRPLRDRWKSDDERKIAVICRLKETGELLFITTYALA